MGDTTYRRHRLPFWAKGVIQRLQGFFLQVHVAKIVIHKADQPNTFFDFLQTNCLTSKHGTQINLFSM